MSNKFHFKIIQLEFYHGRHTWTLLEGLAWRNGIEVEGIVLACWYREGILFSWAFGDKDGDIW